MAIAYETENVRIRPLAIAGAYRLSPAVHDGAGARYAEPYSATSFAAAVGCSLPLGHINIAKPRAGTIRGIHYAEVPPGQAKLVSCLQGRVWDVVVDLRRGSPTYGRWEAVTLDGDALDTLFLPDGMGHGFMSLTDDAILHYICAHPFLPDHEHKIDPFDPQMRIDWPASDGNGRALTPILGRRDSAAPSMAEAEAAGRLPLGTGSGRAPGGS
jgi:dTDP-4-dehydrorhamnose 3,5-epimerase